MQIISNKRLHFQQLEYNDVNGTITHKVKNEIIVNPNTLPQIVPDWVREDDLFNLSVNDGSVLEVVLREGQQLQRLGQLDTEPKFKQQTAPVAEVVGEKNTPSQETGWGANDGNGFQA